MGGKVQSAVKAASSIGWRGAAFSEVLFQRHKYGKKASGRLALYWLSKGAGVATVRVVERIIERVLGGKNVLTRLTAGKAICKFLEDVRVFNNYFIGFGIDKGAGFADTRALQKYYGAAGARKGSDSGSSRFYELLDNERSGSIFCSSGFAENMSTGGKMFGRNGAIDGMVFRSSIFSNSHAKKTLGGVKGSKFKTAVYGSAFLRASALASSSAVVRGLYDAGERKDSGVQSGAIGFSSKKPVYLAARIDGVFDEASLYRAVWSEWRLKNGGSKLRSAGVIESNGNELRRIDVLWNFYSTIFSKKSGILVGREAMKGPWSEAAVDGGRWMREGISGGGRRFSGNHKVLGMRNYGDGMLVYKKSGEDGVGKCVKVPCEKTVKSREDAALDVVLAGADAASSILEEKKEAIVEGIVERIVRNNMVDIADRVFGIIERKMDVERDRRGLC